MIILDTSFWIAYLNVEDSQHQKAEEIQSRLSGKILLPEYVLLEIVNVLVRKIGKRAADNFLKTLAGASSVELVSSSDEFLRRMIDFFIHHHHENLSFVDQSLLYLSQFHHVITFDKALARFLRKNSREIE